MVYRKEILLIVSGGIAAYKSLELIRLIRNSGFSVVPVMTKSAGNFVTPLSLSVISGNKVRMSLHDLDSEMSFGHIELSRQADLVVVAPATANLLSKAAHGMADDLASNILLATNKPVLMAPAMNVKMWQHAATVRNINQLVADGIKFIGPNVGEMACGEFGPGRMAEPIEIFNAVKNELKREKVTSLTGKRILVTSGPTQEPIDPVRYISNRSTGLQGTAIAEALASAGGDVSFITGPVHGPLPKGVEIVRVQTADEMLHNVLEHGPYDIAICAAAVSDWCLRDISTHKLKKDKSIDLLNLELVKTPDVLETLCNLIPRPKLIVGFAAETEQLEQNALKKLKGKKCDWILANSVDPKNGVMGKTDTEIVQFSVKGKVFFPRMSKSDFSQLLVNNIIEEFE